MTRTRSVRFLVHLETLEARDVPSFLPAVSHPVEFSTLRSLAVTNLGGSPSRDVAVTRYQTHDVAVLLGDGTGNLGSPQYFDTGAHPYGLRAGDLNLDGKPDLAVCNLEAKTVSVLLGNGDGTFQPKMVFPAGTGAFWVAIGDVNNDTKPDLAVANYSWFGTEIENTVSVLLGNGDGTFQPFVAYEVGPIPQLIEVGDLNNDGWIDITTTSSNSAVSVLLNQGDGTFALHQDYGVALGSHVLGDVNKDSRLDIVAEAADDDIAVLLGNGDGTFQAQTNYFAGGFTQAPTLGDVNRDRKLDVVVINYGAATVSVLLGNGTGGFGAPSTYPVGASGPQVVALGDLKQDRFPEAVVTSGNKKDVRVLINDGRWAPPIPPPAPGGETPKAARPTVEPRDGRTNEAMLHSAEELTFEPMTPAASVLPARRTSVSCRVLDVAPALALLDDKLS